MAAKKMQVADLRELVQREAVGVEEISARYGPGISTLRMWIRGAVPVGAPPFPPHVTIVGKTRVFLDSEVRAWIETNHRAK